MNLRFTKEDENIKDRIWDWAQKPHLYPLVYALCVWGIRGFRFHEEGWLGKGWFIIPEEYALLTQALITAWNNNTAKQDEEPKFWVTIPSGGILIYPLAFVAGEANIADPAELGNFLLSLSEDFNLDSRKMGYGTS